MATSTIPAVKAALVAAIQARPALSDTKVTWGVPRGSQEREWIIVGNVKGSQVSAALGQQRRDERYVVQIIVSVVKPAAESPQDVCERAYELVAEIEQALRPLSAPPLGVAGLIWALIVRTDLAERFDGKEREAEVAVDVDVKARI